MSACGGLCVRLLPLQACNLGSAPLLPGFSACAGNHERDAPATGDRFYPLQSRTDSGALPSA